MSIEERERIQRLAREVPHVYVVEQVPIGGELGYYSGENMPEKALMLAYSDVFLTAYSTMVVEAAVHDRPIISACIDEFSRLEPTAQVLTAPVRYWGQHRVGKTADGQARDGFRI